ncbi:MAG: hypothetical protein IPI32_07305 [Austwickia sp.]|nr:hypothetical protein [Austwickia sp.]MBK8437144.1 hypothetical protein [Austwickia sp.]MBK9102378.1 hypothetical protein [Austwickia sp.]
MSPAAQELIERAALGPMEFIAEGGQGRVFRCTQLRLPDYSGALAFKEYKPGQVTAAGLEAIIAVRSRLPEPDRVRLDAMTTWPTRLVRDAGKIVGILMPLIRDEYVHVGQSLTGSVLRKEREIQYLFLAAARCQKLGFPRVNLYQRFAICQGLAEALALLAANNVVFGDLNAKNALFAVGPGRFDASVMLVDCDAVRVRGTVSAVPQLNSPDWEPPEGERSQLTHETDVFKYGLFVIRTLSPGPNASTARDPRRVDDVLDAQGQGLLRASLGSQPAGRPKAADWAAYFADVHGRAGGVSTAAAAPAGAGSVAPAAGGGPVGNPQAPAPGAASGQPGGWTRGPNGEWVRAARR